VRGLGSRSIDRNSQYSGIPIVSYPYGAVVADRDTNRRSGRSDSRLEAPIRRQYLGFRGRTGPIGLERHTPTCVPGEPPSRVCMTGLEAYVVAAQGHDDGGIRYPLDLFTMTSLMSCFDA